MNQNILQKERDTQRTEMIKFIIRTINKMSNREIDLIFRFVKNLY